MAAVGGTIKVIGIRMATPFTEPRPGIAPTNNPIRHPKISKARLRGTSAVPIPLIRSKKVSI
jgi:hypothetical protein